MSINNNNNNNNDDDDELNIFPSDFSPDEIMNIKQRAIGRAFQMCNLKNEQICSNFTLESPPRQDDNFFTLQSPPRQDNNLFSFQSPPRQDNNFFTLQRDEYKNNSFSLSNIFELDDKQPNQTQHKYKRKISIPKQSKKIKRKYKKKQIKNYPLCLFSRCKLLEMHNVHPSDIETITVLCHSIQNLYFKPSPKWNYLTSILFNFLAYNCTYKSLTEHILQQIISFIRESVESVLKTNGNTSLNSFWVIPKVNSNSKDLELYQPIFNCQFNHEWDQYYYINSNINILHVLYFLSHMKTCINECRKIPRHIFNYIFNIFLISNSDSILFKLSNDILTSSVERQMICLQTNIFINTYTVDTLICLMRENVAGQDIHFYNIKFCFAKLRKMICNNCINKTKVTTWKQFCKTFDKLTQFQITFALFNKYQLLKTKHKKHKNEISKLIKLQTFLQKMSKPTFHKM
jgi:hypothetical protein